MRHNPGIISSKKIMETNNHLERNNPTAQAIFLIIAKYIEYNINCI